MMYFSRMKATLVLGVCLLGMLVGVPNLFPAPAAWMPWRTVHLGLDLRGGSYLLMEVDMKAVMKERLDSLADGVRQALRGGQIFYQTLEAQPDQNRVLLRLRDPAKTDAAVAALKPLISQDASTGLPDMAIGSDPDGTITLTLSAPALAARAAGRGGPVDRDRPPPHRRNRRGRPADHPPGPQPHRRAASRHRRSRPHQAVDRQDRAYDVPAGR